MSAPTSVGEESEKWKSVREDLTDFCLFAEVREDFLHALGLVDMEETAAVAVAAGSAVLRGFFEREICAF